MPSEIFLPSRHAALIFLSPLAYIVRLGKSFMQENMLWYSTRTRIYLYMRNNSNLQNWKRRRQWWWWFWEALNTFLWLFNSLILPYRGIKNPESQIQLCALHFCVGINFLVSDSRKRGSVNYIAKRKGHGRTTKWIEASNKFLNRST